MTDPKADWAANAAKRKGKANGKKRIKARTMKRSLSIWEMYQNDVSQKLIGEAHGISQSAVSQHLMRTYKEMSVDVREIAATELIKELERCREFAAANMSKALKDPRTADTLLRWMERKDRLLGLGVTKHEISGQLHHTTNLDFIAFDAEELAVLEFLIAKGSGLPNPFPDKRVCLVDSDPVPALEYKPHIESFKADDDIS